MNFTDRKLLTFLSFTQFSTLRFRLLYFYFHNHVRLWKNNNLTKKKTFSLASYIYNRHHLFYARVLLCTVCVVVIALTILYFFLSVFSFSLFMMVITV